MQEWTPPCWAPTALLPATSTPGSWWTCAIPGDQLSMLMMKLIPMLDVDADSDILADARTNAAADDCS